MSRLIDRTGQRYGKLTVLRPYQHPVVRHPHGSDRLDLPAAERLLEELGEAERQ